MVWILVKKYKTKKEAQRGVKKASEFFGNIYYIRKTKEGYGVYRIGPIGTEKSVNVKQHKRRL